MLAVAFPAVLPLASQAQDTQVNTSTAGNQNRPDVAAAANGDFVIVWQDCPFSTLGILDCDYGDIDARLFSSDGAPVGSPFLVNTYTTSAQTLPRVARHADGDFVVVWQSYGSLGGDDNGRSIQARRFSADGTPKDAQEFQVNTYTLGRQVTPDVSALASGGFVVAFNGYVFDSGGNLIPPHSDGLDWSVEAKVFDAAGGVVKNQFQVNSYTTSFQYAAAVDSDASGNFVVVWHSRDPLIHGQRFDSSGTPLGGEFQVNAATLADQVVPSVAVAPAGNFLVAWQSFAQGADPNIGVAARLYSTSGTPIGPELLVNTGTLFGQYRPAAAASGQGEFVVTWESFSDDGSQYDIEGQLFDAAGAFLGSEFTVNAHTTGDQQYPRVAVDEVGNFVVAWSSDDSPGTDTDNLSVLSGSGQFTTLLFTDGFESGNASAWSTSLP